MLLKFIIIMELIFLMLMMIFNDICKNINDGKDVLLKDKEKYYLNNNNLCMKGCYYNKLDYQIKKSKCIC